MVAKTRFGPTEQKLAAYAAPFVLLALLLVMVLVNVKHSMLCQQGGESAAEAMLNRQALEKRLLTLEQETLQNNLLFEKFIRRLDAQFEITKNVDLTAIKNEAHFAAQSVSARLAEENAPPMPAFSDLYNDPTALNDAVDGAMAGLDDQFGYGEKDRAGDDKYGGGNFGGNEGSAGNEGSGSMSAGDDKYIDDFEGVSGGGAARRNRGGDDLGGRLGRGNGGAGDPSSRAQDGPADDDDGRPAAKERVAEAVAKPACDGWKAEYKVQPGIGWGTLPLDLQEKWKAYDCDTYEMKW